MKELLTVLLFCLAASAPFLIIAIFIAFTRGNPLPPMTYALLHSLFVYGIFVSIKWWGGSMESLPVVIFQVAGMISIIGYLVAFSHRFHPSISIAIVIMTLALYTMPWIIGWHHKIVPPKGTFWPILTYVFSCVSLLTIICTDGYSIINSDGLLDSDIRVWANDKIYA